MASEDFVLDDLRFFVERSEVAIYNLKRACYLEYTIVGSIVTAVALRMDPFASIAITGLAACIMLCLLVRGAFFIFRSGKRAMTATLGRLPWGLRLVALFAFGAWLLELPPLFGGGAYTPIPRVRARSCTCTVRCALCCCSCSCCCLLLPPAASCCCCRCCFALLPGLLLSILSLKGS